MRRRRAAVARGTRAELDDQLGRVGVLGLALLAGIGLTVSLLVAEPAFGAGTGTCDRAEAGVLGG